MGVRAQAASWNPRDMYASRHAATAYDLIHAARGKDYAAEATRLLTEIRRRRPLASSLLDVACGTGLHLAAFHDLGLDLAGVERSPTMLDLARSRVPAVPLHEGDMRTFELDREFDAIVCLFSAIGYMTTIEDLRQAICQMAGHLPDGGVLAVEPWFSPDDWTPGTLHADCAKDDNLAVARVNRAGIDGNISTIEMTYVVATPDRFDTFSEFHRMGLFIPTEYEDAFKAAGLSFEHDLEGLIGRGLFIGTKGGSS